MFGVTEEKIVKWGEKGKKDKLIKLSSSPKLDIRLAAVKAMGNIMDKEEVLNRLITCLKDRESSVRIAAIDSLVKIESHVSVEHIRSLVSDTNPEVSEKAKETLKTFGKKR